MTKIALITGASRGLGRSMALRLAAAGVGIVGTYRDAKQKADELVKEIGWERGRAAMLQLDTARIETFPAFAAQMKETLRENFGREDFDYLINNAGTGVHAPFAETTPEQFDAIVDVHFKGPYFLSQTLLPMIAEGGRILNVSSGLTRFTVPGYSLYAAAKGAVEVMTKYMAKELGERGVRVNVLAPGAIETDFAGGMVRDNAEVNRMIASQIALGRVGQPDDIGRAAAAILSDDFAWASGARIEASGGQSL